MTRAETARSYECNLHSYSIYEDSERLPFGHMQSLVYYNLPTDIRTRTSVRPNVNAA